MKRKIDWSGARNSFRSRAFRAGGYSLAAAIVIAIAVALNLMVGALPASWTKVDLTDTGLYSLSSQTEQLVAGLEEDVTVYWIVQDGSQDSTMEQLLERYKSLSKHLDVVEKDPVVYPSFAQQYTDATLYNNSLIVVCGDRSRYISYYDIYVTDYSSYYTNGTTSTQFAGESELTSAIDYVTNEDLPTVYTLTGHGESDLPSELSEGAEDENLLLEELSLVNGEDVPEDADAIILYPPQRDISSDEKDALLTYLQGGGKLLLVTDYTDTDMPNLAELMEYYGTALMDGIVLEGDSDHHMRGYNYYLLPDINSHDITQPLMDGYYILMPVAQGITVSDELRDGLTVTQLLTTSDSAYAKADGYNITTFDNMFDSDNNMRVAGANNDLFLNALDWMCQRESAISIRAKDLSTEYLTVPFSTASTWSVILVAVVPLAFLACGAVVTIRRRRR